MTVFPATAAAAAVVICGAAASGLRTVTDGFIRVSLAKGWYASVAPGVESGRQVAWVLVADFPLAGDAATVEGGPNVPRRKVLVAIGDFLPIGVAAGWPRVGRIALPSRASGRRVSWHVRFAGRGLWLIVTFGGMPSAQARTDAYRILASIKGGGKS